MERRCINQNMTRDISVLLDRREVRGLQKGERVGLRPCAVGNGHYLAVLVLEVRRACVTM